MTVGIVLSLIGFILHIWLVSKAYMYLRTTYWPEIRFHEMRHQISEYVSFKGLSKSLQNRILEFYEFSFRGKFFRKQEISGLLGNELCHLIAIQTRKKLLQGNFLFNQIPDDLLDSMADCLVETVYLADDIICKVNSTRAQASSCLLEKLTNCHKIWFQKLYLIVSGTVAVYSEEGEEVAHLHSGMFGEIAFLINHDDLVSFFVLEIFLSSIFFCHMWNWNLLMKAWFANLCFYFPSTQPSWNYIAVEPTVILTLHLTDFMKILAETPKIVSKMRVPLIEHYSNGEVIAEEESLMQNV